MIHVSIQDQQNAMDFLDNIAPRTVFGVEKAFWRIGKDLKREADNEVLHGRKTGRVYFRRDSIGRRRRHQASAAGESHANVTGTLRKSIGWRAQGLQLEYGYGAASLNAPVYARPIEKGGRRVAARPTLQNSIDAQIRNAEEHLGAHVSREYRR